MSVIPYGRQNITEEDIAKVVETLKSDFLTQGPMVKEFEEKFAKYVGAKYAVAVTNGTDGLHLANVALGLAAGDKVLTTPITFSASANSVVYCGAVVDFVDIDSSTYLMDLDLLEKKLEEATPGTYKGVIPVDFAGYPINAERLRNIADKHDIWIVEDACHAPGGYFTDSGKNIQKCGNGAYSDMQVFSFHPVKHIATGEGGMVTTNNEELYKKLKLYSSHGITKDPEKLNENHGGWYYEMQELGFNYRLSDINCALGSSQLDRADEGILRRNQIAEKYYEAFKDLNYLQTPFVEEGVRHAYHLFIILVNDRKGLYDYLRGHNIFAQIHYIPVHLNPYYRSLGWKVGDLPKAEAYYNQTISLPMFPSLTDSEQDFVIKKVTDFFC